MHSYGIIFDFSDIAQMTIYRCEGVQGALEKAAEKFGCQMIKAPDGVILNLLSERELSEEEIKEMDEMLLDGWKNYLATK
jgi:hypothetical protein